LNLFESLVLGLVQGLTEFLPVSSSGHLVIGEGLFGVKSGNVVYEVLVHFGTLLAVLIYFRRKLIAILKSMVEVSLGRTSAKSDSNFKLAIFIIIGTIPAVIIGFSFKSLIEQAFDSPRWASGMLLVTASILFSTRWASERLTKLNTGRSIIVGLAQALAIMPGISRSGSTIAAGMWLGMNKSEAAEFSFLLSIPAIFGAMVLQIPEISESLDNGNLMVIYLAGMAVSALVGYLSIAGLLSIIRKGKFFFFGLYCAVVGLLGIILL
jgi:undecaprenyl-diphosphatase